MSALTWSRSIPSADLDLLHREGMNGKGTSSAVPPRPPTRSGFSRCEHALYTITRNALTELLQIFLDFIRPDFKALQRILAERGRDGDIGRVAASSDEPSSHPAH